MLSKKLLRLRSKLLRLRPAFSSRILMASRLTVRSFICFEFIFVYGVRKWSRFNLLHVAVQFSQHHLLKRLFSIGYSFMRCQRLVGYTFVGPFLGFLFCSIDLSVCFCASTILSWWLQFCNTVSTLGLWCVQHWFSFSRFLGLFGIFSGSLQIWGLFVLPLWRMLVLFW